MNDLSVFVIVPNKNGIKHLSYSLASLAKSTYSNTHFVFVDDHSRDESISYVKTNYPQATVIINERKKGFAGAVNTGIVNALKKGSEYIAIFNNDIKVRPDWIELIIGIIHRSPDIGLIGFTEIAKDNEALFNNTKLEKIEFWDTKGLPGCLYLCQARVFREIGLFDEKYYMYGEDNDLFYRLLKAGFRIVQTNVPVWHFGEGSSDNKFFATWLAYRNALRFSIKNETIGQIGRMILALLNQGCNPFIRNKICTSDLKRMRRYNIFVGFLLVGAAVIWNIFNIVYTLKMRYRSNSHFVDLI